MGSRSVVGLHISRVSREEDVERELEHEPLELIRCRRLRPASSLALSCEEPNMAD